MGSSNECEEFLADVDAALFVLDFFDADCVLEGRWWSDVYSRFACSFDDHRVEGEGAIVVDLPFGLCPIVVVERARFS